MRLVAPLHGAAQAGVGAARVLTALSSPPARTDFNAAHQVIARLLTLLDTLDLWIEEIPPLDTPQRYGNRAFRTWLTRLETEAPRLLASLLDGHMLPAACQPPATGQDGPGPQVPAAASPGGDEAAGGRPTVPDAALAELAPYLCQSFGNGTRMDYGSGHELYFVVFLCCLDVMGCFPGGRAYPALVLRVFARYLRLVRRLLARYSLEPAGSHGVWGLDDHSFLCYYWGAAQLATHPRLRPKSILQAPDVVAHFAEDYLYFGAIAHIHACKQGPFHEHSPMLYDISGVASWSKVNGGMLKMYVAECLDKFPIVQHLVFGSLFPWSPAAVPGDGPPDAG
jgi:serine/threonine-protein phosphatase 2A activator